MRQGRLRRLPIMQRMLRAQRRGELEFGFHHLIDRSRTRQMQRASQAIVQQPDFPGAFVPDRCRMVSMRILVVATAVQRLARALAQEQADEGGQPDGHGTITITSTRSMSVRSKAKSSSSLNADRRRRKPHDALSPSGAFCLFTVKLRFVPEARIVIAKSGARSIS